MSRRAWIVVGAAVLLAIAALVWWRISDVSPEARIRAQLDRLAKAVRVDAQESLLQRRARVQSELEEVLTKEVIFDVPELSDQHSGRGALVDVATQAAAVWSQATIDVSDVRITIAPSKKNATAETKATLVGTRRDGATNERDERAVTFELVLDGDWRVSAIHVSPRRD